MKKKIGLAVVIFSGILVIIFLDRIIDFIINIQWFNEVGYLQIYFTKLTAVLKLMIPIFIIFYAGIGLYYKSIRKSILKMSNIIEVNTKKRKVEKNVVMVADIVISFILSYSFASNYWYRILQFTSSATFNVKDPIFNKDISFYIFKLPLLESLYGLIMALLIFLVMITILLYFFLEAKDRIHSSGIKKMFSGTKTIRSGFTNFAGKQLAVVSSLILLMLSLGYSIKAYNLLYKPNTPSGKVIFGGGFTDINVTLLFYRIIAIASLITAVIVFISIRMVKFKPIIISVTGIGILVILGGIASSLAQNLIVKSNEISVEEKYIKNNIEYTKKAFNIDGIEEKQYYIRNNMTKEDIKNNRETIDNIKINSFRPALDFYNQVQVLRYYYDFNDIDIDRYNINNKYTQVFISPREINSDSLEPNTWQNKHLVYTHGYGIVMSKVNSVTPEGQPNFVIKDIPLENSAGIQLKNPRIYFGESTNYYAVVNTDMNEFDYPQGDNNQVNKYDGKAGISMSLINRCLFAVNERNVNFLLSQDINGSSKILLHRNIMDRIKKIAPFITYDSDPYIVLSEGKLFWIVDGYTVSDRYPYAQLYNGINYIRNSVKVVVDAFDGTTKFYITDKSDPIINSYSKIFKGLFRDVDELSEDIRAHFRYPEDMYNIQCTVLSKYHMTDPKEFFTGGDLWQIANNEKTTESKKTVNEAVYVVMKLPGEKSEEMVMLEYFNMRDKESMTAMLAARMDKDNYGKLVLYKFPTNETIYGPVLFKKKINQDPDISKEISLWQGSKGTTKVSYGDTMIVPIENSLLYVEPIYLVAEGENSIPEMKKIIVAYGEKIVLADNMEKALEQLFNYPNQNQSKDSQLFLGQWSEKLKEAKDLYDKALAAQKAGDWAKYGEYITKLGEILNQIGQ